MSGGWPRILSNLKSLLETEEVAINLLQESRMAYARCDLLSKKSENSANAALIFEILTQTLLKEHVDYALEATLRHSEGRMRISVELIRVADEVQMWAADYEREGKNLFGISNEVALSIGKQLRLHSARRPERTGLGEGTKSSEAYEYYLKGRYFWNRRLKEDVDLAKKYFAKAIEVDPNYARAHAGLADSYIVLAGSHMPAKTAFEKAQECAEKQFS